MRSYTKNGKYEEGQEITITLPHEIVDTSNEAMIELIVRYIQQNAPYIAQAFQRAFEESNVSSSEIILDHEMFASLQVIDVRSRKRMNYHSSIEGIYPGIAIALEP